jgi:hypothetical protein
VAARWCGLAYANLLEEEGGKTATSPAQALLYERCCFCMAAMQTHARRGDGHARRAASFPERDIYAGATRQGALRALDASHLNLRAPA